jgi:hypothetical protein
MLIVLVEHSVGVKIGYSEQIRVIASVNNKLIVLDFPSEVEKVQIVVCLHCVCNSRAVRMNS